MVNNSDNASKPRRWTFLGRGGSDGSINNAPTSQRSCISPENSRRKSSRSSDNDSRTNSNSTSSSGKAGTPQITTISPTRSEMVSTSLPPVGLTGPTAFEFSPTGKMELLSNTMARNNIGINHRRKRQQYVTFLSSHQNLSEQNTTATGSPVRTIGGNSSSGEKRLFALDLEPIWNEIDRDDEYESTCISTGSTMHVDSRSADVRKDKNGIDLKDPAMVMEEHVTSLLNTTLPFNRPYEQNFTESHSTSPDKGYGQRSPNSDPLAAVSDASLSLEEKLRRERQRVHSNGVTQFTWGSYKMSENEKAAALLKKKIYARTRLNTGTSLPRSTSTKSGSSRSLSRSPQRVSPNRSQRPTPERRSPPISPNKSGFNQFEENGVRIIVPLGGNICIQDGIGPVSQSPLRYLYEKSMLEKTLQEPLTDKRKGRNRKNRRSTGSAVGRDASAIDPQLSPDGSMVAFVVSGEIYVMSCCYATSIDIDMHAKEDRYSKISRDEIDASATSDSGPPKISHSRKPTRLTYGAMNVEDGDNMEDQDDDMSTCSEGNGKKKRNFGRSVTHGLADFVAQEEMDRYRGFWWNENSTGILFARVDESCVPPYRISHQGSDGTAGDESNYEEHRYPFAGESNPEVTLGYIKIDTDVITSRSSGLECDEVAKAAWEQAKWFDPPKDASEYLARVNWLPDGSACVQWQDRRQSTLLLVRINVESGESMVLHREESDVWINLHHMFRALPRPVHPNDCLEDGDKEENSDLPDGSFSYIFVSERTGYSHMYLYTFVPGDVSATLLRKISTGDWIVENILGIDMGNDLVYFTGTHESPLEKHLYVLPMTNASRWSETMDVDENNGMNGVRRSLRQVMSSIGGSSNAKSQKNGQIKLFSRISYPKPVSQREPPNPVRLTAETGMHSITMDSSCRIFVDTCSDINRPTSTKLYSIPADGPKIESHDPSGTGIKLRSVLYDATKGFLPSLSPNPPELLSFPTADGTETLHAALYKPNPKVHGSGPYPLICAVYGGPHVQRVTRSWCQCADMRIQRFCSMGFAVVKCDNRGSSRRGLQFEGAIRKHLGRKEVLDQVSAVRHLVMKRIADPLRVGIYGWSYGGYLAAMCLCRAPDIFSVGIAGAPVTSWDGYDTHYTERYMGLPAENPGGYDESAVFEHVPNMRGKLLIIHGLIDENVHFRHTARLINRLIASGKDYDLLLFPDERHSPRRTRDRIYMEKRICDYFVKNLLTTPRPTLLGPARLSAA